MVLEQFTQESSHASHFVRLKRLNTVEQCGA